MVESEFILPPHPLVVRAARSLPERQRALDIGCYTGRNTHYLANLGHFAVGLTNQHEEARAGAYIAYRSGSANGSARFITGDARELPFRSGFGLILANDVLHLNQRNAQAGIVKQAQELTVHGGINAVSGYLVDIKAAPEVDQKQYFEPGELLKHYDKPGWTILHYAEEPMAYQVVNGQHSIDSHAEIIARKISN